MFAMKKVAIGLTEERRTSLTKSLPPMNKPLHKRILKTPNPNLPSF